MERNNKDGTKTLIERDKLTGKDLVKHEMGCWSVIDLFTEKDDCREAKKVIEYIKNL